MSKEKKNQRQKFIKVGHNLFLLLHRSRNPQQEQKARNNQAESTIARNSEKAKERKKQVIFFHARGHAKCISSFPKMSNLSTFRLGALRQFQGRMAMIICSVQSKSSTSSFQVCAHKSNASEHMFFTPGREGKISSL